MTADAERLAAIQERLDALRATHWSALGTGRAGGDHWFVVQDHEAIASVAARDGIDEELREPRAEFIAHAPVDIAYLLAIVAERDAQIATGIEILTREGVWLQREHAAVKALSGEDPAPEFGPRFDPIRSAEWERLVAERDALLARINAVERTARATVERWEKTDDDDLTDAQYGERGYALGVLAALATDRPGGSSEPGRRVVSEAERMSIEAMKFRDGVPSAFDWPKP